MSLPNQSCRNSTQLQEYQHSIYAVVYIVILALGLLGNLLALWLFIAYMKETKKVLVFMMNLAVADLLQVTSAPALATLGSHLLPLLSQKAKDLSQK